MPPPRRPPTDLPVVELADQAAWRRWLAENHQTAKGVWLKIAKKGAPTPTVTYAEAIDEALCHGWIDGQKAPHDETHWLQRFTPRGPRSKWSQINVDKVTRLIAEQRVRPAGLAAVEAARQDGRWETAYEPQSRATVPDDFQLALDSEPVAREFFETLRGAQRYAFLYRIHDAKRPETRAKRIAQYVEMLAQRRTLH